MATEVLRSVEGRIEVWPLALVTAAAATALLGGRPLVDSAVIVGIGMVVPLAMGRWGSWAMVAASAAVGLRMDEGSVATAFVLPAVVLAGLIVWEAAVPLVSRFRDARDRRVGMRGIARVLVPAWVLVATLSLSASTAAIELFGIGEPIVRLTAVHYLYAGAGALEIARRLCCEGGRWSSVATAGLLATAAAPPVVAAGFVLHAPVPQIGGAVPMTLGVWSSATVLMVRAWSERTAPRRAGRIVAGLTPWVPMVLAVSWAAAQHFDGVPSLSIPDMARFHGLANGVGFVLVGLVATSPTRSSAATSPLTETRG